MSVNIYGYHCVQSDGWRFNYSTNANLGQGWTLDGVSFRTPGKQDSRSIPIYQFHYDQSKTYGGWRFNFSSDLKPQTEGWTTDGVGFYAFPNELPNTVPVYQYHAAQSDGWRFQFSTNSNLQQGWTKDKIAFYAFA